MASLRELLMAKTLKPSKEPTKDFSSPKTAGFMKESDIVEYQNKVLDVNTEKWLEILKDLTFPTTYCPLTVDQARLFVSVYERLYRNLDHSGIARLDWQDKLTDSEKDVFQNMKESLQNALSPYPQAFVKTSSRSPKDGPICQERFEPLYRERLLRFPTEQISQENTKITALLQACFDAMAVTSADEALDLFFRSERIYQDMMLALAIPNRFHENFVIREFVPIDVDMEFRGFVYGGDLVALSQYNYLIFSQRLVTKYEEIKAQVLEYFHSDVQSRLNETPFPNNYIIDFAISDHGGQSEKLWVIEINPYLETTDGALFSWQHERHLLDGSSDFEFRITTRSKPGAKAMLPTKARELINQPTQADS